MATTTVAFNLNPPTNRTFAHQAELPKLPIPPLEDTCKRYLTALEGLQDEKEYEQTKKAVEEFLQGDGPRLHEALKEWAKSKHSYIEEFWYESYLSHSNPVVLALNPFSVLENDPTPDCFVHDLCSGMLEPDSICGMLLNMDQYGRLFGTARIPTERGCKMLLNGDLRHMR